MNRSGLEYCSPEGEGSLAKAGINEAEFDAIAGWGANIVRLPFNQIWALQQHDYDPDRYLASIDKAIAMAAQRNMYTLLDLQWLDHTSVRGHLSNGRPNFVPPLPDLGSLLLWKQLAARYRDEAAVLFDIFNEPHDALPDDAGEVQGLRENGALFPIRHRRVGVREWAPWARQLVAAIRSENAKALIFVSGVDWGYDLEGFPLEEIPDVVYASHVYPYKRKSWDRAFGNLARKSPLFVAEWGGTEGDLSWGRKLLDYLDEREIGWAAWSWSDHPRLIEAAATYQPTHFGALVRDGLQGRAG